MFYSKAVLLSIKNRAILYYNTLTIRKKLFLILTILVLLISMLSFLLLQISYKVYDDELINDSSEILNIYSTNIENELRKVERLTFDVLTSPALKNNLRTINKKESSYEKNLAIESMMDFFRNQSQTEKYISSISYVDINDNMYTVGNSVITFENDVQKEIMRRAGEVPGKSVWIEPQGKDKDFILVRKIRDFNSLEILGTVIIRINSTELVNWLSSMTPQYKANLLIVDDNKNIIYKSSKIKTDKIDKVIENVKSNKILTIDNDKFLLNKAVSEYTNWSYVYLMSYDNIFKNITFLRSIMIICFIIIFSFVVFIGHKFSDSITNPIIILSEKMKSVQKGYFEIKDINMIPEEKCDEVGHLNNDFILMINKINELINESYLKQILVKETQLKALQAQINPHFLYNTLESINWLAIANNQNDISLMVISLGNLLRSSISNKESIITLEEELKLLNDYINIQKIRFDKRLEFHCDVDEYVQKFYILKLTLQPIVENSIKYGLETLTGVCKITITSERREEYFQIIIKDNGQGIPKATIDAIKQKTNISKGTGIGLANIDDRIKLFYGNDFGLEIESMENEGTIVKVTIPYEMRH